MVIWALLLFCLWREAWLTIFFFKYMGANIPGKPREQLNYAGGFPAYERECTGVLDGGFQGFKVVVGEA